MRAADPGSRDTASRTGNGPAGLASCSAVRIASAASVAGFLVAVVVLQGLRADLDPADHTVSDYSLGSYGWIMRSAFVALGFGFLGTLWSLHRSHRSSAARRWAQFLLTASAVGLFIDAAFNTDRPQVPETFVGSAHTIGTWIIVLTFPAGTFLFGTVFTASSSSSWRARSLLALPVLQLLAALAFELSRSADRGVMERVAIGIGLVSLVLLQSQTVDSSAGSTRASPSVALAWQRIDGRSLTEPARM